MDEASGTDLELEESVLQGTPKLLELCKAIMTLNGAIRNRDTKNKYQRYAREVAMNQMIQLLCVGQNKIAATSPLHALITSVSEKYTLAIPATGRR